MYDRQGTIGRRRQLRHDGGGGDLVRRMPWSAEAAADRASLLEREWLVANGLGGYGSGTISGAATRRYHGLLIAAFPAPLGRILMLVDVAETVELPGGPSVRLGGEETVSDLSLHGARWLREFRLESGLPVWIYEIDGVTLEKSLILPHMQNTVLMRYRLLDGADSVTLGLRPMFHFRSHDDPVDVPLREDYEIHEESHGWEVRTGAGDIPPLRLALAGAGGHFLGDRLVLPEVLYRVEASRGYSSVGDVWSPGILRAELHAGDPVRLAASTEAWDALADWRSDEAREREIDRRQRLIALADPSLRTGPAAELVLAADQFIVTPAARIEDTARARAAGGEAGSVIAGYHWFTDWGRDTMISLEGLALHTGRHREAAAILRTFAQHVRGGLIPNLFPEGQSEGLYHTADATLWFFHAVDRYVAATDDRDLLKTLLPTLREIVDHHVRGTSFGIEVDTYDGLLRQGAEGYQLTWMDAKVDDWVVTPRRGKAVEINALWYNALRLLEGWLRTEGLEDDAADIARRAGEVQRSFNRRFWYDDGGYLYDVVDGESPDGEGLADDPAFRPNQVFAISLPHPVLSRERWEPVLRLVTERLLTPVGLRSLAPGHPDYVPRYFGVLRSRDAAYHQGTVWGWLIGPYIDAWLRVHPGDVGSARVFLDGLLAHLDEACIGNLSEVFDAEDPHTPRGCVAQAWSVAEVLRCWVRTAPG